MFIYLSIYFYKKEADRQVNNKNRADYISYKYIEDRWMSSVTDVDLESDICDMVCSCTHNDYIYNEVMSVLDNYTKFNKSFGNSQEFKTYMNTNYFRTIERILMAKHGKLLYKDAKYGILSPPVYDSKMIEMWNINNDIMKWLDTSLKLNGIKYDMVFTNGANVNSVKYDENLMKPIDSIIKPVMGVYYWKPIYRNVYL